MAAIGRFGALGCHSACNIDPLGRGSAINPVQLDKASCVRETSMDGTPSYVELLTCLEMARDVKIS